MSSAETLHPDPVFGQTYALSEADGVLKIVAVVETGGGVSVEHFHPRIEELFEVEEGSFTFTLDGREVHAARGEQVLVPAGARHTYRNSGEGTGRVVAYATPAGTLRGFLEESAAMSRAGRYTRRGIPKGPRAAIELARIVERYRDDIVVTGGILPPPALQPLMIKPLALLGRLGRG